MYCDSYGLGYRSSAAGGIRYPCAADLHRTICSASCKRSGYNYLYMEPLLDIERYNRGECHCQSNRDHDILRHRNICQRMYGHIAGNSYRQSDSNSVRFCRGYRLQRAECIACSIRRDHLFMEPVIIIEFFNGIECYCYSICNHHLHGYREFIGLHRIAASNGYGKSPPCTFGFSK